MGVSVGGAVNGLVNFVPKHPGPRRGRPRRQHLLHGRDGPGAGVRRRPIRPPSSRCAALAIPCGWSWRRRASASLAFIPARPGRRWPRSRPTRTPGADEFQRPLGGDARGDGAGRLGGAVVEAIKENRFHIFTNREFLEEVKDRHRAIEEAFIDQLDYPRCTHQVRDRPSRNGQPIVRYAGEGLNSKTGGEWR